MNYKFLTSLVFLLLITVSDSAVAESVLRFNPFQQPDMKLERTDAGRKSSNALKLRGTVVDGEDSMVNINGKFYRLDEMVSGYRVVNIESGKVTLHRGVNETVLTLNDDKTLR
jgi:hypothetical protein